MLTKTQVVLTRYGASGPTFGDHGEDPVFGDGGADTVLMFAGVAYWEEMGRPDTITVTVEPGDRLHD